MEANTAFQSSFYTYCEYLGEKENSLSNDLPTPTQTDDNHYRKFIFYKEDQLLFGIVDNQIESLVMPVAAVSGEPLSVNDNQFAVDNIAIGMKWLDLMPVLSKIPRLTNWEFAFKEMSLKNGSTVQLIVSFGDLVGLHRYVSHFRAYLKK